jgi:hypothetical protein
LKNGISGSRKWGASSKRPDACACGAKFSKRQ